MDKLITARSKGRERSVLSTNAEMMDVMTREAEEVNALTTEERYFKIAPVTIPI